MRILVVSPKNKTVFNFRGDLIKDMIAAGNEVYVTGPNRDFYEDVMALGIREFREIPLVKDNTNPMGDLHYLRALKQLMREWKPDMVFGYTVKPVIYGSMAAAAAGVPHIFGMVTGLGRVYSSAGAKAKLVRLITKRLYHAAMRKCERVIFQNPDDADAMVQMKCVPRAKTALVNGSGVNMQRFQYKELPGSVCFLMVSRIIREKGVMEYCEAAKKVKKACPQARFVLLGAFDQSIGKLKREDIAAYIDEGIIELPGEVKDPLGFYYQSSVYVLPSYYREGLPRTILEAMACGRPVVTTDWPGCRLAVKNGENGYLVPVKDVDALADCMLRLAKDETLRQQMGQASYRMCAEAFDVTIVNRQMRDILRY